MADEALILQGARSSLALDGGSAAPIWRYWGPRLPDGVDIGPPLEAVRETPSFSLDQPAAFSLFPGYGLGWFGPEALRAHRAGQDFTFGATACRVEQNGPHAARVILDDAVTALRVDIGLRLDGDDVLTVSTRLVNMGTAPLSVDHLASASLPLPHDARLVRSYAGRHNGEFALTVQPLGPGQWRRENRRGLTSHDSFPGAIVCTDGTSEAAGPCFGAQLAWSGSHVQLIEALDDGRFAWQFAALFAPGEVVLAPSESLSAPDVLATWSDGGWTGVARNFHAAIRRLTPWPEGAMRPRPVHLNTWEGFYFDHDLDRLKNLADTAARLGVERFVLDDGWFRGRDDDTSSLGDWTPDPRKYPDGLAPLADHVTGLGMEFGLWVEPEMINPDSDLYRAHPDWVLGVAGRPMQTARNQLVLDLTRPEVADYLFASIAPLLETLPIAYLKWDHNRDLVAAGGADSRARSHRQVDAAYALFDRFRTAFPHIEIEACAGGGGRIDAGMAAHSHRFWTSDCIDAVSRLRLQPGFLQFMPPELMGAHVGTAPAHSTGRSQSLDFRAAVACQGHFGVELDPHRMAAADQARLADWIAFYKAQRHRLHGTVWQGTLPDALSWHAAGSAEDFILFLYREQAMHLRHMPALALPFVDEATRYRLTPVGPGSHGEAIRIDGGWLARAGLPIPHMKAESALIWHGERL